MRVKDCSADISIERQSSAKMHKVTRDKRESDGDKYIKQREVKNLPSRVSSRESCGNRDTSRRSQGLVVWTA